MFEGMQSRYVKALNLLSAWRFRRRARFRRSVRAWQYYRGVLSEDEAQQVTIECRYAAGWYPLETLCVEDVFEQALEYFEEHAELRALAGWACSRVNHKWDSSGEARHVAQDWAVDLLSEVAQAEGIILVRRANTDQPIIPDQEE
jgi:hypothetical protein